MGNLGDKSDYESLRDARISENMARMEMLGLRRRAGELSVIAIASASAACRRAGSTTPRKTPKPRVLTPLRRSGRLIAVASATPTASSTGPRRSARLNEQSVVHKALPPKGVLSKAAATEEEKAVLVIDKGRAWSCRYCRIGGATARGEGACTTMFLGSVAIFAGRRNCAGRTASAAAKETWTSHA